MPTVAKDEQHPAIADVADLKTSCTIDVSDFLKALVKASKNLTEVSNATNYSIASTTALKDRNPSADKTGTIAQSTTYTAIATDKANKFVYVSIDEAQNSIILDNKGVIQEAKPSLTKKELKADYNMKKFGNAVAEWDEQVTSLEKYMIGKTAQEVISMPLLGEKDAHPNAANVDDLKSSCTISISHFLKTIEKASK